jgi:ribosomal protein S27AE
MEKLGPETSVDLRDNPPRSPSYSLFALRVIVYPFVICKSLSRLRVRFQACGPLLSQHAETARFYATNCGQTEFDIS